MNNTKRVFWTKGLPSPYKKRNPNVFEWLCNSDLGIGKPVFHCNTLEDLQKTNQWIMTIRARHDLGIAEPLLKNETPYILEWLGNSDLGIGKPDFHCNTLEHLQNYMMNNTKRVLWTKGLPSPY